MYKLMVSAIGHDQPGIVAAFSALIRSCGCNVEDTSMTMLEDQFTMLYILSVPETMTASILEARLNTELNQFGMRLVVHLIDTQQETPLSGGVPWMISVTGPDHLGIMADVTDILAGYHINIRHLSSKRLTRDTGEILFLMALEVDVPPQVQIEQLQADLNMMARQTQVEVHAEALDVYTL